MLSALTVTRVHHCTSVIIFSVRGTEEKAHMPASPINKACLISAAHCPIKSNKEPSFPHNAHTPNTHLYRELKEYIREHALMPNDCIDGREVAWYASDRAISQSCSLSGVKRAISSCMELRTVYVYVCSRLHMFGEEKERRVTFMPMAINVC